MDTQALRQSILSLPTPTPDGFWSNVQTTFRGHVASSEPMEEFLTWPEISTTMFVGNAPYTGLELEALQRSPHWMRYESAIAEDALGSPPMYNRITSGNLIHQCYHLMQWESVTGLQVNNLQSIVEIGAGYGAMCKIIRRLGFTGEYTIFDLPELGLLQRWYLNELDISATWGEIPLSTMLTPDLLIALWSLSEMTSETQAMYAQHISPTHYLISALHAPWEGEDNGGLFRGMMHFLERQVIEHLPGNYYLLG